MSHLAKASGSDSILFDIMHNEIFGTAFCHLLEYSLSKRVGKDKSVYTKRIMNKTVAVYISKFKEAIKWESGACGVEDPRYGYMVIGMRITPGDQSRLSGRLVPPKTYEAELPENPRRSTYFEGARERVMNMTSSELIKNITKYSK